MSVVPSCLIVFTKVQSIWNTGFRGARSAQNSAGKSKPVQANLVPFEVKMSDFPELAGEKTGPPHVQKLGWCSAPRSTSAPIQTSVFSQRVRLLEC